MFCFKSIRTRAAQVGLSLTGVILGCGLGMALLTCQAVLINLEVAIEVRPAPPRRDSCPGIRLRACDGGARWLAIYKIVEGGPLGLASDILT